MHFKLLRCNLKAHLKAVRVVFCEGAGRSTLNVRLVGHLYNAIEVFIEAIARGPHCVVQVIQVHEMGNLQLELVMSVGHFVDWKANHAAFLDLLTRSVTEASLRDNDYDVLVTEPL